MIIIVDLTLLKDELEIARLDDKLFDIVVALANLRLEVFIGAHQLPVGRLKQASSHLLEVVFAL